MKKTFKIFSMAALALVGTLTVGCSKMENTEPKEDDNVVTQKITINLEKTPQTRALTAAGVKTFAVGDKIAVVYENSNFGRTSKVESGELTAGNIDPNGKTATFTVSFPTGKYGPVGNGALRIIYPASMAKEPIPSSAGIVHNDNSTINYDALNAQEGTLATLALNLDLATFDGSLNGTSLPTTGTLENRLTICAYTLKNSDGSSEITSNTNGMYISDGTYSYIISRPPVDGPIYVAMRPTSSADIIIKSTTGTNLYTKSLIDKTYEAGAGYNISLRMNQEAEGRGGFFTVNSSRKTVYFSKGNLQATYDADAVGEKWTWGFATNQYSYIGDDSGNKLVNGTGTLSEDGTVDLFFYSHTGNSFGIAESHSTGTFSDWGSLDIDGKGSSYWRSLTGASESSEWFYLIRTRPGNRFTQAEINTDGTSVKGVILFPDGFACGTIAGVTWGTINGNSNFTTTCTTSGWTTLEKAGCVFLPAAGRRESGAHSVTYAGSYGIYVYGTSNSFVRFDSSGIDPKQGGTHAGAVRLAHDVN